MILMLTSTKMKRDETKKKKEFEKKKKKKKKKKRAHDGCVRRRKATQCKIDRNEPLNRRNASARNRASRTACNQKGHCAVGVFARMSRMRRRRFLM
jgi:hypothetical protein